MVMASYPYDINGFSHGARLVALFAVVYLMSFGYFKAFSHRLPVRNLAIALALPLIVFVVVTFFISLFTTTLRFIPLYISWVLGLAAAIVHQKQGF